MKAGSLVVAAGGNAGAGPGTTADPQLPDGQGAAAGPTYTGRIEVRRWWSPH